MTGYLTDDELAALRDAVVTLTDAGYYDKRSGLLSGLPGPYRAFLQRSNDMATQLTLDVAQLNRTDRLEDGRVPLLLFMRLLMSNHSAVDPAAAKVVGGLIDKVTRPATGAPPVAPATPAERKEAIVHQDDMLPVAFLARGAVAAAAVARLAVPRFKGLDRVTHPGGGPELWLGTGWLIGAGLLVTNHHVINARPAGEVCSPEELCRQALATEIDFDYDVKDAPRDRVAALALVAHDADLDYALLKVASGARPPLALSEALPAPRPGHGAAAVNIIQHPDGKPKLIAVRNNLVAGATDTDLRYFTDTDEGSSGSPVCDDDWRAVALHRGAALDAQSFQGRQTSYINVGTRVSRIIASLLAKNVQLPL